MRAWHGPMTVGAHLSLLLCCITAGQWLASSANSTSPSASPAAKSVTGAVGWSGNTLCRDAAIQASRQHSLAL